MRRVLRAIIMDSSAGAAAGRLPFVRDAYRRYVWPRHMNGLMGDFSSYEAAAQAALLSPATGWDDPELARHVAGGGKPQAEPAGTPDRFTPTGMPVMLPQTSAYAVLMWLSKVLKPGMRVVDVGGANGKSYWHYRHYFDWPEGATWTVVDRPALVEYGRQMAAEEKAAGLSFATDMDEVLPCDVVLSLGCIQYLPPGDLVKFHRLAASCETLIVNKVALTDAPEWWSVQNYGSTVCPYWIANREAFVASFAAHGLSLADAWTVPEIALEFAFQPERRIGHLMGVVMRRARPV